MKSKLFFMYMLMLACAVVAATSSAVKAEPPCVVPDNGSGTVKLPPEGCSYLSPDEIMEIIDGLPPGTTIEIDPELTDFVIGPNGPGGNLGGEFSQFQSTLVMNMDGTGELAGFRRSIQLPVNGEVHTGPRTQGDPVQEFDTEMFRLEGQLFGDPDFCTFRLEAGSDFGLPSPGHTTLTQLPGGDFAVDSFFDITYKIDFTGCPGSWLEGMAGTTMGIIRISTGTAAVAGEDCYNVTCGESQVEFGTADIPPIPADFFGPGSEPFTGVVRVGGREAAVRDLLEARLDPFDLSGPLPVTETVRIELVELSLRSCAPITVTTDGTVEEWDVSVDLSEVPAPPGQLTATKTHPNGGTFTSEFYVQPRFTFTKVSNPTEVRVLDTGLEGWPPSQMNSTEPYNWQDTSPKANPPCDGNDFYPVGQYPLVMQSPAGEMLLELVPPNPVSPYIALDTAEQWQAALDSGRVTPPDSFFWDRYMQAWQKPDEGEPYPANTFLPPELSVWPGSLCPDPSPWLPSPGLVMAWGDPRQLADNGSYSSAWQYIYPADPDLTNVMITVTVFPPCGMNVVSFGMQDINGGFRAWYWNVATTAGPGTLQCGVGTTINIDTAVMGTVAANPIAASFMNTIGPPAFDITQVQDLIFDENYIWVASAAVPPPGTTVARPWNYWRDLIITPKDDPNNKPTDPVKWSQPPVEVGPAIFLGWDEVSVDYNQPLMADDWLCEDPRPVKGIHWWGSFIDWDDLKMPPNRPTAFQFGIWTDVPKDAANPFSHPGELIWEYVCTDYDWNFAGFDKDPRNSTDPTVNDSCFQFYCDLPDPNWFYQKPLTNSKGRVYWLSIAAIYPSGVIPQYPWGWKTRPHFFNDDAVRIFELADGSWPPSVGSAWGSGEPVEYPEKISWDLSFELTTNEDEPNEPNADLNFDGIVDLYDFAIWTLQYLRIWP